MSSNKKSSGDPETLNKRVTRSSKRTTEIPDKLPESPPRQKKVPAKKNSSTSKDSAVGTPKSSEKGKGGAKSVKSQQKVSQPQEYTTQQGTIITGGKDKNKSARGRGKTRGSGSVRGRNARGGSVKKPAKSFHYWSRYPPTAKQLADMGAEDGCTYALTTKGKLGARNRAYIAQSRADRAAEIAVANLYDSD